MRSASLLCGLAVCGLLAGCGGSSPVGKWSTVVVVPKDPPNPRFALGHTYALPIELEIREEKKFKMSYIGLPVEGSYTQSGKTLTLTSERGFALSIADLGGGREQLILTMSGDGKTMTGKGLDGKSEMKFTRADAK